MNKKRRLLVKEAFRRLDKTGDGVVTVEDLEQAYDASHHPEVSQSVSMEGHECPRYVQAGPDS
jgi:Ca2+-binding EF-hand superfamily protein